MLTALYALAVKLAVLSLLALLVGAALVLLGRFCALSNVPDEERPHARSTPRHAPDGDADPIEGLHDYLPDLRGGVRQPRVLHRRHSPLVEGPAHDQVRREFEQAGVL